MRVLVCGGRNYADAFCVYSYLDEVHAKQRITLLLTGGANGADEIAFQWAMNRQVNTMIVPAKWNKYRFAAGQSGKNPAGPIRNQEMLDKGKPDLIIAFPGGRGTQDMVDKGKEAGIKVIEYSKEK